MSEQRTAGPGLTDAHWKALENTVERAVWAEGRQMGLDAEQTNRIAVAATTAIREHIETWQAQRDGEQVT